MKVQINSMMVWREGIFAFRFGIIGVIATLVHVLVVSLLLNETVLSALLANLIAFLAAFSISFFGNYRWTFQSPGCPRQALVRYLLVSVTAFIVNTLALTLILDNGWLSPLYAAISSASVVPIINYFLSRLWVFGIR